MILDLGIVITSYNTRDLLRTCLRSVYDSQGDFHDPASYSAYDAGHTDGLRDPQHRGELRGGGSPGGRGNGRP